MEALHIVPQNPTENIEDAIFSISKLEKAQVALSSYLTQLKATKRPFNPEVQRRFNITLTYPGYLSSPGEYSFLDFKSFYDRTLLGDTF